MKKTLLLLYLTTVFSFLEGYTQTDFALLVETDSIDLKSLALELALDSTYYENIYESELERKEGGAFLFNGKVDYPYFFI